MSNTDLDMLPEEPTILRCGMCGMPDAVHVDAYKTLRALCLANIEARKAAVDEAEVNRIERANQRKRAESAEARVREMEAAIKSVIAPEGCPPWTLKICDLVDDDELRGIRKQVFTLSINQIRAIIRALLPKGELNGR